LCSYIVLICFFYMSWSCGHEYYYAGLMVHEYLYVTCDLDRVEHNMARYFFMLLTGLEV